jgi:putative FmdB family regulatory protein
MPLYDYDCAACGRRFEVIHGVHVEGPTSCPLCGSGPVRKAFAAPAVHFKGSGWAKKERRAGTRSGAGSGTGSEASGEGSSSEEVGASASGAAGDGAGEGKGDKATGPTKTSTATPPSNPSKTSGQSD